jgi:hypothetical protein
MTLASRPNSMELVMRMLSHLHTLLPFLVLLRTSNKGNLIFVIMRMANYNFIEPHDEYKCDHSDDHSERKLASVET